MTKRNIEFDKRRFNITKEWCKKNDIVPQISKLRITKDLQNGNGLYDFDIKATDGLFPGDVALNRNDVFIPTAMGVLISIDKNTPTGAGRLYSYAPKAMACNEFGFLTSDIEAMYNGTLIQTVDQTNIMQSFPMEFFKHIGANEPVVILNSNNEQVNAGIQGEYDIEDMLSPIAPEIVYQGSMDIKTSIKFPATGADFSIASAGSSEASTTHKARISLIMFGVLVKNGAEKATLTDLTDALGKC